MTGVLIHDGRRPGHRKWLGEAISSGRASGGFITPFSTPRVAEPRHPSGAEVADTVRRAGGEVIFDAMTHARHLATTNKLDFYDEWGLWRDSSLDLSTSAAQLDHVERVFSRQDGVGSIRLAPTLALKSPGSPDAHTARNLAQLASRLDSDAWQSLVGNRTFWSSGADLDAYVGSLVALRASTWVVTVANELVADHVPNLTDISAFSGLCRTVRSLSLRSRVILAYADYGGLPAVAAGADTVGSGWDRGQRTFDPLTYRLDSDPGIRIPASYVTQGELQAVLRREAAEAIVRWDRTRSRGIRGGPMPASDQEQRMHHLRQLTDAVTAIEAVGSDPASRVELLWARYERARSVFEELIRAIPGTFRQRDLNAWCTVPASVLETYAAAEGI